MNTITSLVTASTQTKEIIATARASDITAVAQTVEATAATQIAEVVATKRAAETQAAALATNAIAAERTAEAVIATATREAATVLISTRLAQATPNDETGATTTPSAEAFTPLPTRTPTPTPVYLMSAVVIDDKNTEQDRSKGSVNSYRLLRWRPWPNNEQQAEKVPEGWYYVIGFVAAEDKNQVIMTIRVSPQDVGIREQRENVGWLIYSFDINSLPDQPESCFPYWDVFVGIDVGLVNCPVNLIDDGMCRLTKYSKQRNLATERPGTCGKYGAASSFGNIRAGRSDIDE